MADDDKIGGILDTIISGIGEAVTDIRHKVVEEGYFGRQVTADEPAKSPYVAQGLPATYEEYRASKDGQQKEPAQEIDKDKDRSKEIGE